MVQMKFTHINIRPKSCIYMYKQALNSAYTYVYIIKLHVNLLLFTFVFMKEGVVNRIKQVIDHFQLSASLFATEIGMQRSSISHILSGRNKPSLDMVQRILEKFDSVNSEWMLFGKGEMLSKPGQLDLFEEKKMISNNDDNSTNSSNSSEKEEIAPVKRKSYIVEKNEKVEVKKEEKELPVITENKEIDKIVIFYKDGTFKSYHPED